MARIKPIKPTTAKRPAVENAQLSDDRVEDTEVAEAQMDTDPQLLAVLLHNLAGLAHSRGDDAGAEPLARRGLALRERVCTSDDPAVAADAAALGAILEGLERWTESEALYRRAL